MTLIESYGVPPVPVTPTTWRMYVNGVPINAQSADAQLTPDYPLLRYMSLVGDQMGQIEGMLDDFTYISPAQGGPPAGSEQLYSYSTLVDPWLSDATWLPWLAMVTGTNIAGLNELQARIAIASSPTFGKLQGSKTAIQEAVRSLFSFQLPAAAAQGSNQLTLTLPTNLPLGNDNLLNPGESIYISTDTTWENWGPITGSSVSPAGIDYNSNPAFLISLTGTKRSYFGMQLNRIMPALPLQDYAATWDIEALPTNASTVSTYMSVAFFNSAGASIGFYTTSASPISLTDGVWAPGTASFTTPAGTAAIGLALYGMVAGGGSVGGAYVTNIQVVGPDPYASVRGALLFGEGVPTGATIVDLISATEVTMSAPSMSGISASVAVVPNVPIAVLDHYNSNPWAIGVFVPTGIPLAAAYTAAYTQKPAGYSLTLLYSFADWANLYAVFGNGTSISWSEIAGQAWQVWEQTN